MFSVFQQVRNQSTNIAKVFNNRNPRNLERLKIARKPIGYHLEKKGREFWYKLILEQNSRSVVAKVIHHTGNTVVQASTTEWCIGKHLYRATDTAAYVNLARVLALRCLESGVTEMISGVDMSTGKKSLFLDHFQKEGITLSEAPKYTPYTPWSQEPMEKPWTVHVD